MFPNLLAIDTCAAPAAIMHDALKGPRIWKKKKMFAAKPNATCGILRADTVIATWTAWKLQFQSFVASEMGFNILHMLSC